MKTRPNHKESERAPDKADSNIKRKQGSLFPEIEATPIPPPSNTLPSRLLKLFKEGRTLTHPEFELITGSWRLSAAVHILRKLHWPIEDYRIGQTRVKRFWLDGVAK